MKKIKKRTQTQCWCEVDSHRPLCRWDSRVEQDWGHASGARRTQWRTYFSEIWLAAKSGVEKSRFLVYGIQIQSCNTGDGRGAGGAGRASRPRGVKGGAVQGGPGKVGRRLGSVTSQSLSSYVMSAKWAINWQVGNCPRTAARFSAQALTKRVLLGPEHTHACTWFGDICSCCS